MLENFLRYWMVSFFQSIVAVTHYRSRPCVVVHIQYHCLSSYHNTLSQWYVKRHSLSSWHVTHYSLCLRLCFTHHNYRHSDKLHITVFVTLYRIIYIFHLHVTHYSQLSQMICYISRLPSQWHVRHYIQLSQMIYYIPRQTSQWHAVVFIAVIIVMC